MTTGRSIVSTCAACTALAGNPSDGFGGGVVAAPIPDLTVMAAVREADDRFEYDGADPDRRAIVDAAVAAAHGHFGSVPNVRLSLSSNIPTGVGLADRSATAIAVLRVLAAFDSRTWSPDDLAAAATTAIGPESGTGSGFGFAPLVQAHGAPGYMTFDPVTFERLDLDGFHLFVAWSPDDEPVADTMQRSLRRRFDGGHPEISTAIGELRVQAGRARRGVKSDDARLLADAMHRTLAVRLQLADLPPSQRRLVEIGRRAGAALNASDSGCTVVGTARSADHLELIRAAYDEAGVDIVDIT